MNSPAELTLLFAHVIKSAIGGCLKYPLPFFLHMYGWGLHVPMAGMLAE
jgi:hypothetical protein